MKKKRVRGILIIFISICMCIAFLPVTSLLAENTGTDADFQLDGTTLIKYVGTAETVIVPSTVKTIGKNAFDKNITMKTLTIPSSVTTIDAYAFHKCAALQKVEIGEGVTSIGNSAFADCRNLSSVHIGSKVVTLGSCTFGGCDRLSSVSISASNQNLTCEKGAIYGNKGKILYQVLAGRGGETYTMPDTVTTIKPYCMWGCDTMKTLSFSGSISKIPEYAFYNASGLEFVEIPGSISAIDLRAFGGNENLKEVILPLSAMTIHEKAFEDSPNVKLIVSKNSVGETYAISTGIPYKTTSELKGTYRFELENLQNDQSTQSGATTNQTTSGNNSQSTEQSSKPDTSTVEGAHEASTTTPNGDIDHLQQDEIGKTHVVSGNAYIIADSSNMTVHDGDAYTEAPGMDSTNAEEVLAVYRPDGAFGKYSIYENQIARYGYYEDNTLGYFVIPKNVTSIGELSFARSSISGISIPESVTHIGYGAFYHCEELSYVTIPSSVKEIEPYAFEGTKWKNDFLNGGAVSDFYIVGDGILLFYKGKDTKVTVPDEVKQIASDCFKNHTEIEQIDFPDSLKIIGEQAFMGCSNLRTVTGGTAMEEIQDKAFSGCPLDTIRIPATVTKIGLGAFDYSNIQRDAAVAAVFMGSTIPYLSYSNSATRLSETDGRKKALEGVPIAILWNQNASITGTVLDDALYGFGGFICAVYQEATSNSTGTLLIVGAASNASASMLPESVWVYGNRYSILDANHVVEQLSGEGSQLSEFVTLVESGADSCLTNFEATSTTDLSGFQLVGKKDSTREEHLKQTIENLYGKDQVGSISTFSYELTAENETLPLKDLGNDSVTITMQIPNLVSSEQLLVVTEDADGQIENVPYSFVPGSNRTITFEVSHFSPFAMFNGDRIIGVGTVDDEIEEGQSGEKGELPAENPEINKEQSMDSYVPANKEVNPVSVYAFLLAILLLIIATALWFTKKFHRSF